MATPEELQARLDRLRLKRATGIRATESEGDRVEYRTDSELAAAIADLERQIAATSSQRIHTVMFSTSKGL